MKIRLGTGKVLDPFFLVLDETAQKMTEWCHSLTFVQLMRWQALILSKNIATTASADFVFLAFNIKKMSISACSTSDFDPRTLMHCFYPGWPGGAPGC